MAAAEFRERYGTVVEEVKLGGSFMCVYVYPIFIVRRIVYAAILVTMGQHPLVQLYASVLFVLFPVLLCEKG